MLRVAMKTQALWRHSDTHANGEKMMLIAWLFRGHNVWNIGSQKQGIVFGSCSSIPQSPAPVTLVLRTKQHSSLPEVLKFVEQACCNLLNLAFGVFPTFAGRL